MPANKLIPFVDTCVGAGITKLAELRPNSLKHTNLGKGVYSHLFEGWRAQGNLVAARFGDEVVSTRLFASGDGLKQLCSSEFDTFLSSDPTNGIGEITLTRSTGSYPAGVIRKGHPFAKEADDKQPLQVDSARYEVARDILVAKNQTSVTVPIVSVKTGNTSNIITYTNGGNAISYALLVTGTPLFDTAFTVSSSRVAGGSLTPAQDQILRKAAKAYASGRFGPTIGAISFGAYLYSGVSNLAVVDNPVNARTVVFPTDESWAYSSELNSAVGQNIKDNWAGFGCAIQMGTTTNRFIHIDAEVVLTDSKYLIDPSPIYNDIVDALRFYFNERPDWWTWKEATIKATIAGASRKIFACNSVDVTDALDSSSISEPGPLSLSTSNPIITHYYIADNAININFLGPS